MLGAQWTLLQTVAWTTMLANNLRTHSLSESLTRTFDGKHPCLMCRAIAAAKNSQGKNQSTLSWQKLEFPPVAQSFVLIAPTRSHLSPQADSFAASLPRKPPTPPPRSFFV